MKMVKKMKMVKPTVLLPYWISTDSQHKLNLTLGVMLKNADDVDNAGECGQQ